MLVWKELETVGLHLECVWSLPRSRAICNDINLWPVDSVSELSQEVQSYLFDLTWGGPFGHFRTILWIKLDIIQITPCVLAHASADLVVMWELWGLVRSGTPVKTSSTTSTSVLSSKVCMIECYSLVFLNQMPLSLIKKIKHFLWY